MAKIRVSVICITYNHAKYIHQSLDSIFSQKTDFEFEVIVHDDCSTDETCNILRKYEAEHKNLRVIYETENQYSKGIRIMPAMIKMARGEYVALCETDDYFTNCYKLQRQVDALDRCGDAIACIHAAQRVDEAGNNKGVRKPFAAKEIMKTADIIKSIGRNYALNSLMFRKYAMEDLGALYYQCSVGDIPYALHLGMKGSFIYIDEIMSAYRMGSQGSWTNRMSKDLEKNKCYMRNIIATLQNFDEMTKLQYHETVIERLRAYEFQILQLEGNRREIFSKKYIRYFWELPLKQKVRALIKAM